MQKCKKKNSLVTIHFYSQIIGPHAGPTGRSGEVFGGGCNQSADLEAQLDPEAERHRSLAERAATGHQGGVQQTLRQLETANASFGTGAAADRERSGKYPGDGAEPGEHGAAYETAIDPAAIGGDGGSRARAQRERGVSGHPRR